jgi:hypothetical protein
MLKQTAARCAPRVLEEQGLAAAAGIPSEGELQTQLLAEGGAIWEAVVAKSGLDTTADDDGGALPTATAALRNAIAERTAVWRRVPGTAFRGVRSRLRRPLFVLTGIFVMAVAGVGAALGVHGTVGRAAAVAGWLIAYLAIIAVAAVLADFWRTRLGRSKPTGRPSGRSVTRLGPSTPSWSRRSTR